ncbi:60Kd inner membrane protein-domain-containing protein [Tribonema minus]|uniref:60Kd inner membrane protein-domain-containing protein n=1 Tax=Tribonema minus TaxID=303371 RepID=A0A836CHK4_9STRA|nr:60Kd inner membrane protein-domain-containing protein [Tribonema minus]
MTWLVLQPASALTRCWAYGQRYKGASKRCIKPQGRLPWWLSIATTTVGVRCCMLPLAWVQLRAQANLGRAVPDIGRLTRLLKTRLPQDATSAEKAATLRVYMAGVKAALQLHRVSLVRTVIAPLCNIPVFICFVAATREMLRGPHQVALSEGGTLWFIDLTAADQTFVLPVTAACITYLSLEIGFGTKLQPGFAKNFKGTLQTLLILSLSVTTQLPSGVFCYWITSALFSCAQSYATKTDSVRSRLGLPPLPTPPPPAPPTDASTRAPE